MGEKIPFPELSDKAKILNYVSLYCSKSSNIYILIKSIITMPKKTITVGPFGLVSKLGEGGMGAVYKAVVNPESPYFADFVSDIIAWREAIRCKPIEEIESGSRIMDCTKFKHGVDQSLDELIQKEREIGDIKTADFGGMMAKRKKLLDEIKDQKHMRKELVTDLVKAQNDYVLKRKNMLRNQSASDLTDYLTNELGVMLPLDMTFAIKAMLPGAKETKGYQSHLARLQEEAKALVSLVDKNGKSPENVVTVYSFGPNWYAMDFIRDKISANELIGKSSVESK
jgi:serine/threonine protein kinase